MCGCGRPLPVVAVEHGDPYCSSECARLAAGVAFTAHNPAKVANTAASVGTGRYANRRNRYKIGRAA